MSLFGGFWSFSRSVRYCDTEASTSSAPSLTLKQSRLKAGLTRVTADFLHLTTAQGTHSSSYIGQSLAVRHSGMVIITQGPQHTLYMQDIWCLCDIRIPVSASLQ